MVQSLFRKGWEIRACAESKKDDVMTMVTEEEVGREATHNLNIYIMNTLPTSFNCNCLLLLSIPPIPSIHIHSPPNLSKPLSLSLSLSLSYICPYIFGVVPPPHTINLWLVPLNAPISSLRD